MSLIADAVVVPDPIATLQKQVAILGDTHEKIAKTLRLITEAVLDLTVKSRDQAQVTGKTLDHLLEAIKSLAMQLSEMREQMGGLNTRIHKLEQESQALNLRAAK